MDPTTLAIIEAAQIASTIFGAIENIKNLFGKKPKTTDPVSALKPYLQDISQRLSFIGQQNQIIIQKIDALPEIMRGIIRDELHIQRLADHYNKLNSLYLTLCAMEDGQKWDLSSYGWNAINESLTYIYTYEFRISKIGELLLWTDFSDYASGGKARSVFSTLLNNKEYYLLSSKAEAIGKYELAVKSLRQRLSTEYVAGSNIEAIVSIENLEFIMASDKTKVIQVSREVVIEHGDPGCCRYKVERKIIVEDKTVPDDAFNLARDAMRTNIEGAKLDIHACAESLQEICAAIGMLDWYRSTMVQNGLIAEPFITVEPSENEIKQNLVADQAAFALHPVECY